MPWTVGYCLFYVKGLANNKKLKELNLGKYGNHINEYGYFHFTQYLCKKSTILDTLDSNHTLEKLNQNCKSSKPRSLMFLLKINEGSSKSQAALQKIFMTHWQWHQPPTVHWSPLPGWPKVNIWTAANSLWSIDSFLPYRHYLKSEQKKGTKFRMLALLLHDDHNLHLRLKGCSEG